MPAVKAPAGHYLQSKREEGTYCSPKGQHTVSVKRTTQRQTAGTADCRSVSGSFLCGCLQNLFQNFAIVSWGPIVSKNMFRCRSFLHTSAVCFLPIRPTVLLFTVLLTAPSASPMKIPPSSSLVNIHVVESRRDERDRERHPRLTEEQQARLTQERHPRLTEEQQASTPNAQRASTPNGRTREYNRVADATVPGTTDHSLPCLERWRRRMRGSPSAVHPAPQEYADGRSAVDHAARAWADPGGVLANPRSSVPSGVAEREAPAAARAAEDQMPAFMSLFDSRSAAENVRNTISEEIRSAAGEGTSTVLLGGGGGPSATNGTAGMVSRFLTEEDTPGTISEGADAAGIGEPRSPVVCWRSSRLREEWMGG